MAISGKYDAICTPNGLLADYAAVHFGRKSVRNNIQWFMFDASATTKPGYRFQTTRVTHDETTTAIGTGGMCGCVGNGSGCGRAGGSYRL